jgi:hypothetical protein
MTTYTGAAEVHRALLPCQYTAVPGIVTITHASQILILDAIGSSGQS